VLLHELDDDGQPLPTRDIENWYFDPTGQRDVFGSLKEPVRVTQTSITQHYAPPMQV
jgi:hypothetical protein